MAKVIVSVDQSTTTTKAFVFDAGAAQIGRFDVAHRQLHPQPGWVEHDPEEIFQNTRSAIAGVLEQTKISHKDIAAIAIANQRETTLLWDDNGPLYNAVVWQCARAQEITERREIAESAGYVKQTTGLRLSPYFSAAKAKWILENAGRQGKTYFGTVDSWLLWKLTGRHATDYSNASRTQLFNIHTLQWDDTLLKLFGLESLQMPEVCDANQIFGYTTVGGLLSCAVPVAGVLGDSHAALFAQQCWHKGMAKATFGTGSSVMMHIGDTPVHSQSGLATSIAWGMDGLTEYVLEGNINCSGDTLKWLKDELGILPDVEQSQSDAQKVPSSQGVYLVPAFVGLGAPHWRSDVRAVICGLSRDSNRYHIIRAGLESIAYQIKDVVTAMAQDANMQLDELRVDGGPTKNGFLMQFVADQLNTRIVKSQMDTLSALGAAYAGGLAVGLWDDRESIRKLWCVSKLYMPQMSPAEADKGYEGWQQALGQLMHRK